MVYIRVTLHARINVTDIIMESNRIEILVVSVLSFFSLLLLLSSMLCFALLGFAFVTAQSCTYSLLNFTVLCCDVLHCSDIIIIILVIVIVLHI